MESQIITSPIRLDSGTKDSHSVHPERVGDGVVVVVSSFSLCLFPPLSLHVFLSSTSSPPLPPSLFYFQSSVLPVSADLTGINFKKAPLADGGLAARATSLDESTAGSEKGGD